MPTVLYEEAYRFFFYAGDRDEPIHIHVERDENSAKFWLLPVRLRRSNGFKRPEIRRIRKIIEEKEQQIERSWNEYFNG